MKSYPTNLSAKKPWALIEKKNKKNYYPIIITSTNDMVG